MNDGFKQRLVGAIVLLSVALILWPVIFSGPNGPQMDRRSQIPPTPDFEKYQLVEPKKPAQLEPIVRPSTKAPTPEPVKVQKKATVKAKEQKVTKPEKPHLDKRNLPVAWVLQVASFSRKSNAEELKKALLAKGHKAFTRTIATAEGKSTRVYIGPVFNKTAFDKDRAAIDKAFKVKSMVVRFEQ